MLDLVRWRKAVGRKETVPLNDNVLLERAKSTDYPLIRSSSAAIVAVRQGHLLATAFHPELTDDDRFHRYFLTFMER